MRYLFIVFILAQLVSCTNNKSDIYHYNVYDKNESIKGYYKRIVVRRECKRVDSIYRYDINKKEKEFYYENVSFLENGIKVRNGEDYLLTVRDTCYEHSSISGDSYKICYLGQVDLDIGTETYKNIHKFFVKDLQMDGSIKYKYFDENFVLVRNEFKEGYIDYYRVDRVKNSVK